MCAMSLGVRLERFRGEVSTGERLMRLTFRGVSKTSKVFEHRGDVALINQSIEWPIARGLEGEEKLEVHLLAHNRFLNNRILALASLSLHRLLDEPRLQLQVTLLDTNNRPIKALLEIQVWYMGPGMYTNNLINLESGGQDESGWDGDLSDDQRALIDIEKNIANIERSMNAENRELGNDKISGSRQSLDKLSNEGLSKRKFYISSEKLHKKRSNALKSVKNMLTMTRRKSTDSEDKALFGTSMDSDVTTDGEGMDTDKDELLENDFLAMKSQSINGESLDGSVILSPVQTKKKKTRHKKPKPSQQMGSNLRAQDFQICITVIEARQLAGLNMDPVVCVQVGDQKKYTSVKESTNCPYYNEYFVFDFHMAPVMLFDKIITLTVMQRQFLRTGVTLGTFKLDVATIMAQQDHQFYHKWAVLTDPDDTTGGPKGYLKCDISIITKGDAVKIPPKSERDEDDIEGNLLLPVGVRSERQRAKFIVRIYRADGLPRMNSSLVANLKHAFGAPPKDLVDPYVQVSFAGLSGRTSVKRNSYSPAWNEQIVFTEMFPPLCQRIKIQLRESDAVGDTVIGTHFIDLSSISDDKAKGFLPTFGPAFIHMYGSTRDYSLLDENSALNEGIGEGVSYRGRLLIAIKTEISDSIDTAPSEVEVEPTHPINEAVYNRREEFFLFSTILEATMLDKRVAEKPVSFEVSIGNAGNGVDGELTTGNKGEQFDNDDEREDLLRATWSSTTPPVKPMSHDRQYFFMPYWDAKPAQYIRVSMPDHRRRMYISNCIGKIADKLEENLHVVHLSMDAELESAEIKLRDTFDALHQDCSSFVSLCKTPNTGVSATGKTRLDKERVSLCIAEIDNISNQARQWKIGVKKGSVKEKYKGAQLFLETLRRIMEDPQDSLPDVYVWMLVAGRRIAYQRISARSLLYSSIEEEKGTECGTVQTLFLKFAGKKSAGNSGWIIQAKLQIYLWLGLLKHKKCYPSGLPPGFQLTNEILNAEKPNLLPPEFIFYTEKHYFQMRANVYQARSIIGSDNSGLSDPFARVIIGEQCRSTQVIDETLSPTWDELMLFPEVLIYGRREDIKAYPPSIIIEIYDQDKVGKAEFLGRAIAKPHIYLAEEAEYFPSGLEWFQILRGTEEAGELLATFEMFELGENSAIIPPLPLEKEVIRTADGKELVPILPVPPEIRPTLVKYRFEVLFWGLRDLKRVQFMAVDRPRVDIECGGHIIQSSVITNARKNPNFSMMVKHIDIELPEQELYCPPLTIRVVDCRSFGRFTLVGTHTSSSIHKFFHTPKSKRPSLDKISVRTQYKDYSLQNGQNHLYGDTLSSTCGEITPQVPKEINTILDYSSYANHSDSSLSPKKEAGEMVSGGADQEEDEESMDWWTKYFASIDSLIEEGRARNEELNPAPEQDNEEKSKKKMSSLSALKHVADVAKTWGKLSPKTQRPKEKSKVALLKVFPNELENQQEFSGFSEWLQTFDLYRGKKEDDIEEDNRVVGKFKGCIKIYKLPLPGGQIDSFYPNPLSSSGVFTSLPSNEPMRVLVRVYVIKAKDLHPMDINGKADPYLVLQLGTKRISDKENYVSKQLNPVFGKCFEIEASFPQDSLLQLQLYDWDLLGSDDLIGESKIDLENRFYSQHRATSGLATKYDPCGYNKWRDPMKPSQILTKLCKEGKLDGPHFGFNRIRVGDRAFSFNKEQFVLESPSAHKVHEEKLSLAVLHHWDQIPKVGCPLVPEHIETRALYNPDKPGIEQGKVELWVDMFPMDMPLPTLQVDISPRKPSDWELRVIIWNTDEVVLEDDAFFTGEKMSDIYVKGWLKGPEDVQATDVHYRSLTGEGNFNWRFLFPFQYLPAEEKVVISRKESVFSWDETVTKIPPRINLQVWDADSFSKDDFLGSITLDLNRFPRGAKTSAQCSLDMLKTDGSVPMINLFKQGRTKGWWPFYAKDENDELLLQGKVEAELILFTEEEAEKSPAGLGREDPNGLEKPTRPDSSFMWFLNPLKSIRYIVWHNHKWTIIKIIFIIFTSIFLLLFFYSLPGYSIKKLINA